MRNALIRMGAIFLFVGLSAAQAVEELVEATAIAPAEYAVFYTGFCAERVGLKLISVARGGERDVEGLIKKAEASVPHLLKRCPGVEEIVADVRSRRDPTNAAYFTMRRADNWNPKATITSVELRSVLDAAGYRVVAGPRPLYAKAYWRLEKERFELVYGNDLENRMVATHFARQGASEYRIRGQLYELGYSESGRRCDTSREGYPLWGVFTMEVSADLQALPITIDWCAGVDGAAFRETTELFELPWPGAVSGRQESTPLLLGRALSNTSSTINAEPARDGGSRPPLIDREFYRVYATQPDLCTQLQFDVVYRVNHERRDSVFSGSYTRAISNVVGSLVSRRCGSASRFVVNAYEVGDVNPWDSITFEFDDSLAAADEVPFRVKRRRASEPARLFDEQQERNRFGPCEGPFCEYSGGRYLNAIYLGELEIVRQIDGLHRDLVNQFVGRQRAVLPRPATRDAYDALIDTGEIQLLKQVANKYMHAYGMWGESCLDPGAEEREYSYTTPVIVETDEYGTTTSGGDTFSTTYTLNPEFFALRDQLASHRGAARSDAPTNLEVKASIYRGLVQLIETSACRSPDVKQFERQLRRLTAAVLESPGVLEPTAAVRPVLPERVLSPRFAASDAGSGRQVAWNPPAPLPSFSSSAGSDRQRPAAMSREERMAQLNEEMRKAQEKFERDMAAIQLRVSNAQRAGASQADIMRLVQDSQREMLELQEAFQQEMFRIQQQLQ